MASMGFMRTVCKRPARYIKVPYATTLLVSHYDTVPGPRGGAVPGADPLVSAEFSGTRRIPTCGGGPSAKNIPMPRDYREYPRGTGSLPWTGRGAHGFSGRCPPYGRTGTPPREIGRA